MLRTALQFASSELSPTGEEFLAIRRLVRDEPRPLRNTARTSKRVRDLFSRRSNQFVDQRGLAMLTRKQLELLKFINERSRESGVPPSFDEMKEALDLRSKSGSTGSSWRSRSAASSGAAQPARALKC